MAAGWLHEFFAVRHPTVAGRAADEFGVEPVVNVIYLATAMLGLWASYRSYRPFGIQIIEWMQVGDFQIGRLRDPMHVGLARLMLAVTQVAIARLG